MDNLKNNDFCVDSFMLIKYIINFCDSMIDELNDLTDENYFDKFKETAKLLNIIRGKISKFTDKWEKDDEKICWTLNNIKDFYSYYCITLHNSAPALYKKDAKYIIDSLNTSKLALNIKLPKIKHYL